MKYAPWIQTFTGRAFSLLNPSPDDIDIADIAHSLSMQCRFAGHTKRFYSVAEHCVLASRAVPGDLALVTLMHDAAEAYVQDITRPLKEIFTGYRDVENRIWRAIAYRYNLPGVLPEAVKLADMRMLATEAKALMGPPPQTWNLPFPSYAMEEIGLVFPEQLGVPQVLAHAMFMDRFSELITHPGLSA